MCLHRPAAAVGGGADGRGRRSDLTREHHCQMWQGQPLLWSVGEKPPRGGATCETRYETFDVISANGSVVGGKYISYFSFFLSHSEVAAIKCLVCSVASFFQVAGLTWVTTRVAAMTAAS